MSFYYHHPEESYAHPEKRSASKIRSVAAERIYRTEKNQNLQSMSEKHKQMLLAGNAAIEAGNNEEFLNLCAEDTDWDFIGGQQLRGKQAVREWMMKTYAEPPVVSVKNLIAEGDFLVAQGEVTMQNESGIPTKYSFCDVWEFRDELIVGLKGFVIESV